MIERSRVHGCVNVRAHDGRDSGTLHCIGVVKYGIVLKKIEPTRHRAGEGEKERRRKEGTQRGMSAAVAATDARARVAGYPHVPRLRARAVQVKQRMHTGCASGGSIPGNEGGGRAGGVQL